MSTDFAYLYVSHYPSPLTSRYIECHLGVFLLKEVYLLSRSLYLLL